MTEQAGSGARAEAADQAEKDRVVTLLGQEWSIIAGLLDGLADEAWSRPALPGWTVHDVLSHLIGTEHVLAGADRPTVPQDRIAGDHVRNDIARLNEAWIVTLRERSHSDLLADFRAITAERLASLRAMSAADFNAPSWTPAGNATYARFMQIRIFDCWMHEQDIRAAVGIGGNEGGPIAEEALAEVVLALGYLIGKRGGAPEGSRVLLSLTGPIERDLRVAVNGRATVVDSLDGEPTASLKLSSSLFFRLAGGREDAQAALGGVALGGDTSLARQLALSFAYTI